MTVYKAITVKLVQLENSTCLENSCFYISRNRWLNGSLFKFFMQVLMFIRHCNFAHISRFAIFVKLLMIKKRLIPSSEVMLRLENADI